MSVISVFTELRKSTVPQLSHHPVYSLCILLFLECYYYKPKLNTCPSGDSLFDRPCLFKIAIFLLSIRKSSNLKLYLSFLFINHNHFYILSETWMLRNDYFHVFFKDHSLHFSLKSVLLNQ